METLALQDYGFWYMENPSSTTRLILGTESPEFSFPDKSDLSEVVYKSYEEIDLLDAGAINETVSYSNVNQSQNMTRNFSFDVSHSHDPVEYIFDRGYIRAIFLILYSIVFCSCFFGNLMVILVVTLHWRMRSITNFCLANLAFADLCVGIFCVYQHIITYLMDSWVFGEFLCKMYHFINSLSTTASVLILVVICIERYLAIIHPMTCKQIMTSSRLRITIVFVWILSAVISSPRFYYFNILSMPLPGEKEEILCLPNRLKYDSKLMDMVSMIMLFLIPLAVISFLYTKIGIVLWKTSGMKMPKSSKSAAESSSVDSQTQSARIRNNLNANNANCKSQQENVNQEENEKHVSPNLQHPSLKFGQEGSKERFTVDNTSSRVNHPTLKTFQWKSESVTSENHEHFIFGRKINSSFSFHHRPPENPEIPMRLSKSYPKLSFNEIPKQLPNHIKCVSSNEANENKIENRDESNLFKSLPQDSETNVTVESHGQKIDKVTRENGCNEFEIKSKNKTITVSRLSSQCKTKTESRKRLKRKGAIKDKKSGSAALKSRRRIIKMLIVVVLAFALGHLPFHARKVWQYWSPKWAPYQAGGIFSTLFTPVTFLVMYGNSGINPILYAFMSQKFRMSFKDFLCCRLVRRHRGNFDIV